MGEEVAAELGVAEGGGLVEESRAKLGHIGRPQHRQQLVCQQGIVPLHCQRQRLRED